MGKPGIGIFFAVMVVVTVGCAKDIVTGRTTLNYYKISDEPRFGEQVLKGQIKELRKHHKAVDSDRNAVELARIRRIVERLARVSHYPTFPYEAHLADVAIVNAWCAPGGKIMVYEGLWDEKEGLIEKGNDAQLAAVLGHEIAHATARHVTESLSKATTAVLAGTAAQTAIGVQSGEGADLFGRIFSEGMNIFIPSYSRKNELEADRLGLVYMARAGFDPRMAVELWRRAARKHKSDSTSIYASHPSSGKRARELEKYLPEAIALYEAARAPTKEGP